MNLEFEILLRFAVALLLSAIVGWERERVGKPAGLRTHMLVGAGSSLFIGLGELLVREFQTFGDIQRVDPMRLIEAVVTGVSFLGAGTIFFAQGQEKVKGLTTAASLWTTAAVGVAVGLGRYVLAAGVTVMLFLVLHAVGYIERRIGPREGSDAK
jgi:putative Mg2+ transporter-C (MgtC) family protein